MPGNTFLGILGAIQKYTSPSADQFSIANPPTGMLWEDERGTRQSRGNITRAKDSFKETFCPQLLLQTV